MATPLKVLVVEDDQLTLEMIGTALNGEGVEVIGVRDGREAGLLIEKEIFDGIFLDLTVPGLSGLELAARIRASTRNATTPIVVITGSVDTGVMKEAFAAGAHFFLSKPLDVRKLRNLVNATHGTLLRERRRNRLVPFAVSISCRVGVRIIDGITTQLSEQGLVCRLDESLRVGEQVHLTFRLATSSPPIDVMSVVVPTGDDRYSGCQFKSLSGSARESVRSFVDKAWLRA